MAIDIARIQAAVPSPLARTMGGFERGRAEAEAALAQQAAQERQLAAQAGIRSIMDNPNAGSRDYANLMLQFPEIQQQLEAPLKLLNEDQRATERQEALDLFATLETGSPDIAKSLLERRIEASRNSGDEEEALAAEAMLAQIDENPQGAKAMAGLYLANAMGEDKFESVLGRLRERGQDAALQDIRRRQAIADANLTQAQADKVLADTENLGLDVQLKALELESLRQGGGAIPDKELFDMEDKIRDEFNKRTAESLKVQESFRRVKSSQPTAAGDLALIFNFMKMLDPGSVVREGEFANAQNAAGVDDRVRNWYNRLVRGERLNPDQRASFMAQAESTFNASRQLIEDVQNDLGPTIRDFGLSEERIFGPEEVIEETLPEGATQIGRFNVQVVE